MELTYRKAEATDAEMLIEIYNAAFEPDVKRFGGCPAYGYTVERMQQSMIDYPKYIIMSGGVPIGCISFKELEAGVYEVGCLCIIPEFQGKGAGRAAIEFAKSHLTDWRCFTLVTPFDKTENMKFYTEKCGFEVRGYEYADGVKLARLVLTRNCAEI